VKRRWLWLGLLSLALLAGVTTLAWISVQRLEFFRIRSIEVAGIRHLDERDLVSRLAIPEQAHILVDTEPIAERAAVLPGVRDAAVTRRWPGTLVVTIKEAPAVAWVREEGQLLVIDDRAGVLPVEPARLTTSLPLADRDSALAALLGRLQVADPQWFAALDRARSDGPDAWLEAPGHAVRIEAAAGTQVLLDLAAVRDWLEARGIGWTRIDARFRGRMFVRKDSA